MKCKKCKINLPDEFSFCPNCGCKLSVQKQSAKRRPRGSGCVFKRKENRAKPWVAMRNGTYLGYFETEKEAAEFLNSCNEKNVNKINYTLEDIHNRWQKSKRYIKLSDSARGAYSAAWKRMLHLKDLKMRDLKTIEFQSCIELAESAGCSRDSCEKLKSLASVLCQEAMKDDIIDRNYSLSLELPEKVYNKTCRNFTDEEIIILFDNDSDYDVMVILCLIYCCGPRVNEFFNMLKDNVFLSKGFMIGGSKTEAGKNRIIPIRNEVTAYIKKFMEMPGEYLVTSKMGMRIKYNNWLNRNFYPTLSRVGINYKDEKGNNILVPHRTRHTYIAGSIAGGAAPEALTKVVGHANYETSVNKYGDLDVEFLRKEAAKGL